MGKFITLTIEHNGQPILVNVDSIATVHQDYTLKTETTYIEQEGNSLAVQESVESVANLIRRAETGIEKIIHCNDCKWFQCNMRPDGYLPKGVDEFECRHWCGPCDPVDFCSHAERREE